MLSSHLPTRLVEAATPEWRPIQWSLGFITVGLTLAAVYLAKGSSWLRRLAFPVCFFLVAIPWPTLIELPIIQGLTRFNAAIVVEVMCILGVPAIQHGNVVAVATGVVGINRAWQRHPLASIQHHDRALPRGLVQPEAVAPRVSSARRFSLAMLFNVCRMSLLTYVAAKRGLDAVSHYHDPAGVSIAVACFLGMWVVALVLSRKKSEAGTLLSAPGVSSPSFASPFRFSVFCVLLSLWLAVVEFGVPLWYHTREAHLAVGPAWSLDLPTDNPTFKAIPIDARRSTSCDSTRASKVNGRRPMGRDGWASVVAGCQAESPVTWLSGTHRKSACQPQARKCGPGRP